MEDMPERVQMEAIRKIVPVQSKLRDHLDEREDALTTFEKLLHNFVGTPQKEGGKPRAGIHGHGCGLSRPR